MSWYGDPDALDAHARLLAADAGGVRARARALEAHVAQLRWRGAGAQAFRATVEQDAARLRAAAAALDEAAAAVQAHTREVRARLERIRLLERAVPGWFDEQLSALQGAARAVTDAVIDPVAAVRRGVSAPPWSSWSWRPGTLPAAGDIAWLEVGEYLRGRGVRL